MPHNPSKTILVAHEELEDTQVRKTGRFLFFKTTWWETILTRHLGNDIHIETDRPIRHVFLNGKELTPSHPEGKEDKV